MNILLTSAGRRTYLIDYFKAAIAGNGQIHASNSIYTYSLEHADHYTLTPNIYDNEYIDFLLNYCKSNNIDVIIPLFDIDLPVLSTNKNKFNEIGTQVIVSDSEVINICNDKWLTYQFLIKTGINTPRSYLDINDILRDLHKGVLSYPIIIKPRWGMGSIGIYQVDNDEELKVLSTKLHREIFNTYLKYESRTDINDCIIYQEKVHGNEYGIEVLNDLHGNYVTTLAKRKIAMRAGETDIAEVIDPKDFKEPGEKIARNLRHIANLDVDVFINEDGELIVLEMNCRFGGQYPFSHLAGANFPKQIIEWCHGAPTDENNLKTEHITACKDLLPVVIDHCPSLQ